MVARKRAQSPALNASISSSAMRVTSVSAICSLLVLVGTDVDVVLSKRLLRIGVSAGVRSRPQEARQASEERLLLLQEGEVPARLEDRQVCPRDQLVEDLAVPHGRCPVVPADGHQR